MIITTINFCAGSAKCVAVPHVRQNWHGRPRWIQYVHICISYPAAYLKYLDKYILSANVSAYVKIFNTYVCRNYSRKIVVLRISVSGRQSWIYRAQLSYVNSFDTQILTYFTYAETFAVNAYLFKYFKYATG